MHRKNSTQNAQAHESIPINCRMLRLVLEGPISSSRLWRRPSKSTAFVVARSVAGFTLPGFSAPLQLVK